MGVAVLNSTMKGGYTPICEKCGVALCWDISEEEYKERLKFWDNWICKECKEYYEKKSSRS